MAQPSSALLPSTRAARDATCLTPGHDKTFCTPQVHLVDQPQRPGSQSELNRLHRPTQSPRAVPLAPHPHASALQVVDPRPMYSGTSAAYRGSDRWAFWDPPLPTNQQQTTLPPSSPNEKRLFSHQKLPCAGTQRRCTSGSWRTWAGGSSPSGESSGLCPAPMHRTPLALHLPRPPPNCNSQCCPHPTITASGAPQLRARAGAAPAVLAQGRRDAIGHRLALPTDVPELRCQDHHRAQQSECNTQPPLALR